MSSTVELKDEINLGPKGGRIALTLMGVGALLLAICIGAGFSAEDHGRQFFHSYLLAVVFALSIALGGLFFVTLQHLTRAGWTVVVRRTAESLAATLPLFFVLLLPILLPMMGDHGNASLYMWVDHDLVAHDHLLHKKEAWLNVPFFLGRVVFYFTVWSALAWFFLSRSRRQDTTKDPKLTLSMETVSAPGMIVFALTVTFASFDLLMSLEPHWFSTVFGIYFFAGSTLSIFAVLSLFTMSLQRVGFLKEAVNAEHYQDLGKFLFAFVFFWGYIAFSQYMLIWYANVPEETEWFLQRQNEAWVWVSLGLLFGHFLLPFPGLLSKHVKRNKSTLAFWAIWLLGMHWLDLYWLIMPNLSADSLPFHWLDVGCLVGVLTLFIGSTLWLLSRGPVIPVGDPRLQDALAFENM